MNRALSISLFFFILVSSCKKEFAINNVEFTRIEINDSLIENQNIKDFITPYKKHVDSSLNSTLCYAPETYSKSDGELNTAIGNMMADAVYKQANPVFFKRHSKSLDFVLLNFGGIRAIVSEGNVTARTAYEVMPFENEVVVVGLKGDQLTHLINFLQQSKRAHPISSQLQIILNAEYDLVKVSINGQPIDENRTYYIATNDYLYHGGDRMTFFQPNEFYTELDYKIRSVLLDYFSEIDTLQISEDQRFYRILE